MSDMDAGSDAREGGCLCGAVRFRLKGEPLRVGICHCQDCRRTSGSTYTAYGIWPRADFESSGDMGVYSGRGFCPTCGSRIGSLTEDEAEIMIGSLDDAPSGLVPQYELWVGRREEWLHALPWAKQFAHDRE